MVNLDFGSDSIDLILNIDQTKANMNITQVMYAFNMRIWSFWI